GVLSAVAAPSVEPRVTQLTHLNIINMHGSAAARRSSVDAVSQCHCREMPAVATAIGRRYSAKRYRTKRLLKPPPGEFMPRLIARLLTFKTIRMLLQF